MTREQRRAVHAKARKLRPGLPWSERVSMLAINPDAATREDVVRMAADLMDMIGAARILLDKLSAEVVKPLTGDAITLLRDVVKEATE